MAPLDDLINAGLLGNLSGNQGGDVLPAYWPAVAASGNGGSTGAYMRGLLWDAANKFGGGSQPQTPPNDAQARTAPNSPSGDAPQQPDNGNPANAVSASTQPAMAQNQHGLLGPIAGGVERAIGGLFGHGSPPTNGAQPQGQAPAQQPQDPIAQLIAQNRPSKLQTLLHAWSTGQDFNTAQADLTKRNISAAMLPNTIRAGMAQTAIENAINQRIARNLGLGGDGGYPAQGYTTGQQPQQGAPGMPSGGVGYPAAVAALGAPAAFSGGSGPVPAGAGGALPPVPQTPNLPPVPSLAPTIPARVPTVPAAMPPQQGQPVARAPIPAAPQALGASSFPLDRDTLALMAYQGHPGAAEAWKIEQPNYVADRESGGVLDATTGQPNGVRLQRRTNVNGFEFDPYDKNAPNYLPKAPADGAEPLYDQRGVPVGWRMMDGSVQTIEQSEQAQSRGKARGDLHTIKTADGREAPVWGTDIPGGGGSAPSGGAGGPHGGYGGQGGAPGGYGGPSGGFGQSTAEAEYDKASAGALSQRIEQDTGTREGAISAGQQAQQALNFVKTHPMNPGAPYAADWANNLRALSQNVPSLFSSAKIADIDRAASDPATYERLATQAQLQGAKTLLPSRYTERELNMLGRIYPQLETPNDSAAMFWAQYGSMANRQKTQADFAANYNGPKNVGAYAKAWADSPAGQRSIFQDPIWNGVTINGRPAVAYVTRKNPKTGATEQFGAFNPYDKNGTPNPNAYVFRVR